MLIRYICGLKLDDKRDMKDHINSMSELFEKLAALGEESLSEKWIVAMLLSSLPRCYDTLITVLESYNEENSTVNLVQSKLIEEYFTINRRWKKH